jgi:repressor LexA
MTQVLSERQGQLLDYLRKLYDAGESLPPNRQICQGLACSEGELRAAARSLRRLGYIEEAPESTDDLRYRILRNRDGSPLSAARPSYLRPLGAGAHARPSQARDPGPGELTPTESRVLSLIHGFFKMQGYPPTLADLADRSLTAGVTQFHKHVVSLADKRWIERLDGSARAIRLKPCAFRLLGPISFGLPVASTEDTQAQVLVVGEIAAGEARYVGDQGTLEELQVPVRLLRKYDRTELFALRVVGLSMVDRGLQPGDYLVVRAQPHVESGEITAALIDEADPGATVKTYRERAGRPWLEPGNAAMGLEPIPAEDVALQGKVIALLRFYEAPPLGTRMG